MRAYSHSATPEEDRDKRQTPKSVFNRIQEIVNIPIIHDLAAEDHTAKCGSYWTIEDDSFSKSWIGEAGEIVETTKALNFAFWLNPPYSDPEPWLKKAVEEAKNGLFIVGLLPDDRSTGWYKKYIEDAAQFVYIPDKRISFEDKDNNPQRGNPKGSIFPVWTPFSFQKTSYERFIL